jgi:YVTN family beta-propeller protein
MTHLRWFILLSAIALITACRKDDPRPDPSPAPPTGVGANGVYVLNEGNFQWGNASVSYYDIATGQSIEDLYQPANGAGLGDVLQSMTLHNGRAYLVVNNSGKVVVVDPHTFVATGTITGLPSPRYLLPVGDGRGYITDMQSNTITVVDLNTLSVIGGIPCPGWTEQMALAHGKVFVTNETRRYLYVIDATTDQVIDSLPVSRGASSMVADANGKLWVACMGGGGTPPALYRIDPLGVSVEEAFTFGSSADSPWRLCTNGDRTVLYFLNDHVYRMAITDAALPATPFVAANGRNFYALGVEPGTGVVYAADAIDFTQRGVVSRYAADGTLINEFLAGRAPVGFVFP